MSDGIIVLIIINFFLIIYVVAAYKCKCIFDSLDVGDLIYTYTNVYNLDSTYTDRNIEKVVKIDKRNNIIYTDVGNMYNLYDFYKFSITKV